MLTSLSYTKLSYSKGPPDSISSPIVFLHGLLGTSEDFLEAGTRISSPAVGIDLPGHGRSTGLRSEAYSLVGAADLLSRTVEGFGECRRKMGRMALVGYSMGARVALEFASRYPNMVEKLVLESVSPGLSDASEKEERRRLDAERAGAIGRDYPRFLKDWYTQPLFQSLALESGRREALIGERLGRDPVEISRAIEGFSPGRSSDYMGVLGELEMPVLLVAGSLDTKYMGLADLMVSRNPGIRRVIIEGAGHNTHLEQPDAYLAALETFLNTDLNTE